MSTRGDILRRAAQVEPGAVPEPWRPSDDEDALATVSDREHYRKNLVTLPDGAGEVPAYVWDFPRTPTIPDEVREEWTRSSAGRVLNAQGQFVSRGSDVPRLSFDGDEAGLLVEAAGRTNEITYSSDFIGADWLVNGPTFTPKSSILKSETAQELSISSDSDNISNNRIGTFSNSLETYSIIIEYIGGQAAVSRISMFSDVNGRVAYGNYFWDTNSTTTNLGNSTDARVLKNNGPNGGKVVQFTLRYDPSTDSEGSNGRQILLFPDRSGNNENMIFHHAQIEEAPNASSPIVTGGSPTTRSGDDYAIFEGGQPPWWNANEGTFLLRFAPRFYRGREAADTLIEGSASLNRYFQLTSKNFDAPFPGIGIGDTDSNFAFLSTSLDAFSTHLAACSFTSSEIRVSANGAVAADTSNGSLLSESEVHLNDMQSSFGVQKILYLPRALPESTLNRITAQ